MSVGRRSSIRWSNGDVRVNAQAGTVVVTAPCGETRTFSADEAEKLARRLLKAAADARNLETEIATYGMPKWMYDARRVRT